MCDPHWYQLPPCAIGWYQLPPCASTLPPGQVQHIRNKVRDASDAAAALAKAAYSALFDHLVERINLAVGGERGEART